MNVRIVPPQQIYKKPVDFFKIMAARLSKLPQLLDRKIYKTGQTRGADDDVIYQNRVARNSTVLIPYAFWKDNFNLPPNEKNFENGIIVLISPNQYFETPEIIKELDSNKLKIGKNCLVFYETRSQWIKYNPERLKWQPAKKRLLPLGGQYVARVPATTAVSGGGKIVRGFTTTSSKGAGIRVYEYASTVTNKACRDQLETLYWLCFDSEKVVVQNGMVVKDASLRKRHILEVCAAQGLLDFKKLVKSRVINEKHETICPLCLERLSGKGFFNRMQQAEGREVPDLTVTEINLFHIEELRTGLYNHRPYNLGWGHHHCNVVTKDAGIKETLKWMGNILKRNAERGYFNSANRED